MTHKKSLGAAAALATLVLAALVGAYATAGSAQTAPHAARAAAGSDPTTVLKGKKFAFALATAANPLIHTQGQLFVQGAKKVGATATLYDNKGTAADMLANARLMVAAHPDVIVEYPSVANATTRVSQIFKQAHIPCISVNVPVAGCPLFNFDQPYLAGLAATAMAKQMAARGWNGNNTTVVIGQAAKYGPSVNIAVTSFYDKLSSLVPGMTHVASSSITPSTTTISGNQGLQVDLEFTADVAFPAMTQALQSIPTDRHIVLYTTADDVTVAAQRAIQNAGRTKDTIVSGFGGSPVAINALRAGTGWVTEQTGFFANWGEFALAMAAAIKQGVKLPALTEPPMIVLTKQNVDKYFKPGTTNLILMPQLPTVSRYLYKTGVLQKFGNVAGAK